MAVILDTSAIVALTDASTYGPDVSAGWLLDDV